jgi:NADH-quinone oxidoreductase subunit F
VAAFLGRQQHLATEYCGHIDPIDLDEYLAHGGFQMLEECLRKRSPAEIIETVRASGLRGRGGAGYLTGRKWEQVRAAAGSPKYIICNGDEGDPGAFMDRMILESYPYRVIEGMAIAAHAVGAEEGVFYIRAEYPLAVRRVGEALRLCKERGVIGDNLFGTGRRLNLRIMQGAGAFVCGEETALLASIEGRRGMPRLRPPYPAVEGLWAKPTLVNNVETYALVPWILRSGAAAFAAMGTGTSKGTKVFALAGKIARGGLIEVPMGVTLREIVEEIGGGLAGGKRFKAVQVGGPSGGCVPAELADTPVDYEALTAAGAIMGSGGLVVLDESDCMVDVARYFLEFTQDQSCGKCTPCRIGTRRMLDILERLVAGDGRKGDLEELEHLARFIQKASLCGLGKTAPNPVLSTLRYFRSEYEAHLEKRCPAGRCKQLVKYTISDECIGCTLCAQHCPSDAIPMTPYEKHVIDQDKCIRCDTCKQVCPVHAVCTA